jgi:hypothetical protein
MNATEDYDVDGYFDSEGEDEISPVIPADDDEQSDDGDEIVDADFNEENTAYQVCEKRSYTGGLDDIWSDTPTTKLTYEEFASYNRSRSHTVHVEIKPDRVKSPLAYFELFFTDDLIEK